VIAGGRVPTIDANARVRMAKIGMPVAFAALARRKVPEARRTCAAVTSGKIRSTVARARHHIAQIVQRARIVTITFSAAFRREVIRARHAQVTFRAHDIGFAWTLAADRIALSADRTGGITVAR
jgi:hypothetical protein